MNKCGLVFHQQPIMCFFSLGLPVVVNHSLPSPSPPFHPPPSPHSLQVHEELEAIGAASAESRARRILAVSYSTSYCVYPSLVFRTRTHTHTHTHARMHARTHAHTHTRTHTQGLSFTVEMQGRATRKFSGGWRMRVSLARWVWSGGVAY